MDAWHQLIAQVILESIEPSTMQTNDRAIISFISFVSSIDVLDLWPVSEAILLRYLAKLRKKGLAPKTIGIHLSAISFYSKEQGFNDSG